MADSDWTLNGAPADYAERATGGDVHLYSLGVGGLPAGWTATATGGNYDALTNTLAFAGVFLGEGANHPFSLTFSAPCGATSAVIDLTSRLGYGPANPEPEAVSGPALATVTCTRTRPE